jgi:hypothetical protein
MSSTPALALSLQVLAHLLVIIGPTLIKIGYVMQSQRAVSACIWPTDAIIGVQYYVRGCELYRYHP